MEIIFEGKKFELHTNENGDIVVEKVESPFQWVSEGLPFYAIDAHGVVQRTFDSYDLGPGFLHDCANYCSDKELLTRRAFYEKIERCLWRFSMENGGSGDYYLSFDRSDRTWVINKDDVDVNFGPSFKTSAVATRAVEEVILPMVAGKAEEEIFVWRA